MKRNVLSLLTLLVVSGLQVVASDVQEEIVPSEQGFSIWVSEGAIPNSETHFVVAVDSAGDDLSAALAAGQRVYVLCSGPSDFSSLNRASVEGNHEPVKLSLEQVGICKSYKFLLLAAAIERLSS
jgi:hypothetical protein